MEAFRVFLIIPEMFPGNEISKENKAIVSFMVSFGEKILNMNEETQRFLCKYRPNFQTTWLLCLYMTHCCLKCSGKQKHLNENWKQHSPLFQVRGGRYFLRRHSSQLSTWGWKLLLLLLFIVYLFPFGATLLALHGKFTAARGQFLSHHTLPPYFHQKPVMLPGGHALCYALSLCR